MVVEVCGAPHTSTTIESTHPVNELPSHDTNSPPEYQENDTETESGVLQRKPTRSVVSFATDVEYHGSYMRPIPLKGSQA